MEESVPLSPHPSSLTADCPLKAQGDENLGLELKGDVSNTHIIYTVTCDGSAKLNCLVYEPRDSRLLADEKTGLWPPSILYIHRRSFLPTPGISKPMHELPGRKRGREVESQMWGA